MRILVTGVSGAVGRFVARQLVAAGHVVTGIATRPDDRLNPEVSFVCASLSDPVLQQLADEADAVIHLAPIEANAPGCAGITGVVRVTDAAARAGARLLFVSHAAGEPQLYRQAESLVSTSWGPSLIVRIAPPVGRQSDWMVARTVASLLRSKMSPQPVRLVHLDDLARFLVLAVATDRTGSVDLASPDATNTITAWRLLQRVGPRRVHGIATWTQLTPEMDVAAAQEEWTFEFGWSATEAVADTARGLAGRRLQATGATDLPGRVPLPVEPRPRLQPADGTPLQCAAPEGLEGEFDDRIDPRFPVFSATCLTGALPGPLTPLTLDVQLAGLRAAARVIGQAMTLGGVVAGEWESRAIAVFGHRPYVGVSANVLAAAQLPGWDQYAVAAQAADGKPRGPNLLPLGQPRLAGGLLGSAAKSLALARSLAMARHLKADTQAYSAAAMGEHVEPAQLAELSDAGLEVRIGLLRDRIHQGWSLMALWLIDTGVTAAMLEHTRAGDIGGVAGIGAILESDRIAAEIAPLVEMLRGDPRLADAARDGDVERFCASSDTAAAALRSAVAGLAHRGPGEAELANPTFGDNPAMLLKTAAAVPPAAGPPMSRSRRSERWAANARSSREQVYDATMRFTHELRMALRELGSRRVRADLIDTVDDVYYLTSDELVTMPSDARLRVKRRRAERERLQALRLPDVINGAWLPIHLSPAGLPVEMAG
ncbi:NAD-dependent epimerase/dehydratase family protein [Mycobacterium sp. SM1]|uniref:NAD-dependent epimerase/dehydratase family protein n=1 Tax=Mycobacterium sp. SM1 TaxID=2816243 RepID=UPI001BD0718A|nr:NAD-dependent epimerase/dehydratase family protein [Mycobacterium sp. SM1]MBS4729781.1 NAD-dependent epimerase/dehydratase family protein [Mycobacterium sp. SM1]